MLLHCYAVLALLVFVVPVTFGHGLGLDTLDANINGAEVRLSAQLPTKFEDATKQLTVMISRDDEGVDAVFWMGVKYMDEYVIQDTFTAPGGTLYLDITTAEVDYDIQSSPGSAQITGPIFHSGGLYTVHMRIESLDGEIIPDSPEYLLDLLVTDTTTHITTDAQGAAAEFTTASYFDRIREFRYDSTVGVATFVIPFDWGLDRVSHIPVIHQEVRFPADFEEFVSRGYVGTVNGVELFRSSITVDDFSTPGERTVHFVLLQDHINLIRSQMERPAGSLPDNITFTLEKDQDIRSQLSTYTRSGDYQVDMTWEPEEILPGQKTKFIFTIRDAYTGETIRQSSYDFALEQDGRELYRSSGVAVVGGDFREYEFGEEQAGAATVRLENIRGTGEYVEFVFVVAPEFEIVLLILAVSISASALIIRSSLFRGVMYRG